MKQDTVYPPPPPQYYQTQQTYESPHTLGTNQYHPYTNYPTIQTVQRPSISKAIVRNNVIFKLFLIPAFLFLGLASWALFDFILTLVLFTNTESPLPLIDASLRLLYTSALGAFYLILAFREDFLLSGSAPLKLSPIMILPIVYNSYEFIRKGHELVVVATVEVGSIVFWTAVYALLLYFKTARPYAYSEQFLMV